MATKAEHQEMIRQQTQERISRGKFKVEDFKQKRLTTDDMQRVPPELIFGWVKLGLLGQKHFMQWVNAVWEME